VQISAADEDRANTRVGANRICDRDLVRVVGKMYVHAAGTFGTGGLAARRYQQREPYGHRQKPHRTS
jgi:hypothetical protein